MADKITDFLKKKAAELKSLQVKVGFIDGATYPDGTKVAEVAFKNEFGVPENNQPARPFFRNAISEHSKEWGNAVARGIRAGLPTEQVLEAIGALAASDVYTSITQLTEPPLAAFTIKKRQEKGNFSVKPLEDTKTMLNDINYQVGTIESEE